MLFITSWLSLSIQALRWLLQCALFLYGEDETPLPLHSVTLRTYIMWGSKNQSSNCILSCNLKKKKKKKVLICHPDTHLVELCVVSHNAERWLQINLSGAQCCVSSYIELL